MAKISEAEKALRARLSAAEAAVAAKAQELEDHLRNAATSHRVWLTVCLVCLLVGALLGHIL